MYRQTVAIGNDEIVRLCIVVLEGFQMKTDAEDPSLSVFLRFIRDDAWSITDYLSCAVRKIQLIGSRTEVSCYRLLLEKVQRKNHIADLATGGEQTYRHRTRIISALIFFIFSGIVTKEMVVNERHDHLL